MRSGAVALRGMVGVRGAELPGTGWELRSMVSLANIPFRQSMNQVRKIFTGRFLMPGFDLSAGSSYVIPLKKDFNVAGSIG